MDDMISFKMSLTLSLFFVDADRNLLFTIAQENNNISK